MNKADTISRRQLLNASIGIAAVAGLGTLAARSASAQATF
jgi:hypothetical protein